VPFNCITACAATVTATAVKCAASVRDHYSELVITLYVQCILYSTHNQCASVVESSLHSFLPHSFTRRVHSQAAIEDEF